MASGRRRVKIGKMMDNNSTSALIRRCDYHVLRNRTVIAVGNGIVCTNSDWLASSQCIIPGMISN